MRSKTRDLFFAGQGLPFLKTSLLKLGTSVLFFAAAPVGFVQVPDFHYRPESVSFEKAPMYIAASVSTDATPLRFTGIDVSMPRGKAAPPVRAEEPQPDPRLSAEAPKAQAPASLQTRVREITVHFGLNQATLTPREKERLLSHRDLLLQADEIEITGYTCRRGSKVYNDRLARRRADAVREYLAPQIVHPGRITKVARRGKCCYVSRADAPNRRTVLRVSF